MSHRARREQDPAEHSLSDQLLRFLFGVERVIGMATSLDCNVSIPKTLPNILFGLGLSLST